MESQHKRAERPKAVIRLTTTQEVVSDTASVVTLLLQDHDTDLLDQRCENETALT